MTIKPIILFGILFILGFGINESFATNSELLTEFSPSQNGISTSSTEQNTTSNLATVGINPQALKEDKMNITVFGEIIEITHEKTIQRAENDFTYIGSTNDSFKNVWIAYYDGVMRIEMSTPQSDYVLTPTPFQHIIKQYVGGNSFGAINEGSVLSLNPNYQDIVKNTPIGEFTRDTHHNLIIDVIYLYTEQAEDNKETGGQRGIRLMGNLGVDKINDSFIHAGIPIELKHVETSNVDRRYVESGDMETELERLINTDDNYMKRGIALRDKVNADIGILFLGNIPNPNYCGQVSQILADAENAFVAINVECPNPIGSVIAHEFGHIAGVYHDYDTNINQGNGVGYYENPFSYGHGYSDKSIKKSTVMAYPCTGCEWQNIWSDPGNHFERTNTIAGTVNREDSARVLIETAPHIASFEGDDKVYVSKDSSPPIITPPSAKTFEATTINTQLTSTQYGTATVTDDIDPNPTLTNNAPATFLLGDTTITWTARDSSGKTSTATQIITITDTTDPIITTPADITLNATGEQTTILIGEATATDIFPVTITKVAPDSFLLGETIIIWTATDSSGNTSTGNQIISVIDTTRPLIIVPSDQTFQATRVLTPLNSDDYGIATATDSSAVTITNNAPNSFPLGSTHIIWTATDSSGNTSTGNQIISVVDNTDPVITIPSHKTFEATALMTRLTSTDYGIATAVDDIDPNPEITNNAGISFRIGTTLIEWTATDSSGNTSSNRQTITIKDTTDPIITAPADITLNATGEQTTILTGEATATDIFPVTITKVAPDSFPIGVTLLTWTATDSNGNTSTTTQTITVEGIPITFTGVWYDNDVVRFDFSNGISHTTFYPDDFAMTNATVTHIYIRYGEPINDVRVFYHGYLAIKDIPDDSKVLTLTYIGDTHHNGNYTLYEGSSFTLPPFQYER